MKENNVTLSDVLKVAISALVLLAVAAAIILGGWEAGWWFTAKNASRDDQVNRTRFAYQQTLREQVTAKISDVTAIDVQLADNPDNAAQLKAQRHAIANIACQDASQVNNDLPTDQVVWVQNNCLMGSAK